MSWAGDFPKRGLLHAYPSGHIAGFVPFFIIFYYQYLSGNTSCYSFLTLRTNVPTDSCAWRPRLDPTFDSRGASSLYILCTAVSLGFGEHSLPILARYSSNLEYRHFHSLNFFFIGCGISTVEMQRKGGIHSFGLPSHHKHHPWYTFTLGRIQLAGTELKRPPHMCSLHLLPSAFTVWSPASSRSPSLLGTTIVRASSNRLRVDIISAITGPQVAWTSPLRVAAVMFPCWNDLRSKSLSTPSNVDDTTQSHF